ncbi:MAG: cadherin-like domain-containing protein, partial [Pseudomonadota bacterium]
MSISDDFSAGSIAAAWTPVTPNGSQITLGTSGDDAFVQLETPNGDFDIWDQNGGARLMQSVADEDLSIEARFLSTPTERFQMQGFLFEQDANNWVRLDTYSDGTNLRAFGAITVNGNSTAQFNVVLPTAAPFLRASRQGDLWTLEYSADGAAWTTAGSFTHAMSLTTAGLAAGNTGRAKGYVATVDYVQNTASPIQDEDGTITPPPNGAPVAIDDALSAEQDVALTIDVAADLLANDTDADLDPLSLAGLGTPSNGTLVDNQDGTLTYTPNPGFSGSDGFTYDVTDGTSTVTGTVTVTLAAPAQTVSIVADDFSDGVIDSAWTAVTPGSSTVQLATTGADGVIQLATPDGNYDIWNQNGGARLMQSVSDGDLSIEARFLSTPTERFQMQGFLFEQDANNWIRLDVYSDGKGLRAFGAVTVNGSSSAQFNVSLPTAAPFLRAGREGDVWTLEYSSDGTAWTTAGSFTHAMSLTSAGLSAGNTGKAKGFVAEIDYVQNTASPIQDEDGTITPPQNTPPVAVDDTLSAEQDVALTIDVAADLLANDTDVDLDALSLAGIGT